MSKSYLESQNPPPTPHTHIDSLTNNYSDGNPIRRRCIIEGLELELIRENSLVSVTHHFEVAEYFNRALFLRGNEIQTKSEDEEGFCLFLPLPRGTNGRFGVDCSGVRQLGSIFTTAEASTSHKQFI